MTTTLTPVKTIRSQRIRICGFCSTGHHGRCAVGTPTPKGIHLCLCDQGGCEVGRRKCTNCNNRATSEVNPDTWQCFDVEACNTLVETRRDSNPLVADIRKARTTAMARVENEKTQKAEQEAKVKPKTYCLVTGEETKGGLFKPGMDARYVSNHVEAVMSGAETEEAAQETFAKDGISDALKAKFGKSLRLAREKVAKKEQAAKDKEAAKAAKAQAASEATAEVEAASETSPDSDAALASA